MRKTDWLAAVNSSDRVKTVLRSEVLCGYPALRVLREPGNYSNELHKLGDLSRWICDWKSYCCLPAIWLLGYRLLHPVLVEQ